MDLDGRQLNCDRLVLYICSRCCSFEERDGELVEEDEVDDDAYEDMEERGETIKLVTLDGGNANRSDEDEGKRVGTGTEVEEGGRR